MSTQLTLAFWSLDKLFALVIIVFSVQNFLGKQLNGQNGPDVKATIVQYSRIKPSDIKVIGMEDIHKAKYSIYFAMDQVGFQNSN